MNMINEKTTRDTESLFTKRDENAIKYDFPERLLNHIEEGRFYHSVQAVILFIIGIAIIVSSLDRKETEMTRVFEDTTQKIYHIKKVSKIPKEKEKEEADKIAVEEENLSVDDLKQRYYAYVVSRIEAHKLYPPDEMEKGHEGSVVLQIIINRSGRVEKVRLIRQARYQQLTMAAVNAVRRSVPFTGYNKRISEDRLVLELTIQFKL